MSHLKTGITPSFTDHYDLVIIGGGIHGVGIAQAAAAGGHSVLVLEQNALAAGTSSRSSKLIHGGLRYLESGQFSLVRECLQERNLLLKLAPELVKLQPFYIPIYKHTQRRPWQVRSGLSLYAALGGFEENTLFTQVPRQQWGNLDGIKTDGLQKVYRYFDGQTDDAALTRAVMASAQSLGAELAMPAEFIKGEVNADGCLIHYKIDNQEKSCQAKLLVNASGPWANHVLDKISPKPSQLPMDLVQGTHIIVEGRLEHGIYYVEAPQDQRAVFAIPWKGKFMIGTTETIYQGDPAQVKPLASEETYLCQVLADYFPQYKGISREDFLSSFAGLRVLPRTSGSAFSRPRDTIFHTDEFEQPKVATVYGGKLTAYRITAEKFMQRFSATLPQHPAQANTREIKLTPI